MAGKKNEGQATARKKDGKPKVDRFEDNWDGVPNFKLMDSTKKQTPKKPATKKK